MSENEQPTAWEKARRPAIELAKKVLVTHDEDEDGDEVLLVNCTEIMRSENDVRYWVLHPSPVVQGWWFHGPSGGDPTPLSEALQAIANCYTDRMQP